VSLRFLLDTNALSEPLRPVPNEGVIARIEHHSGALATASTVWHELLFGVAALAHGRRRNEAERYLDLVVARNFLVLPYDGEAASWHAHERARLKGVGRPVDFADGQIAAVAAVNGLTLVTANTKHFARFRGLRVVDWTS
jgi:tRNA(fMet)-specific endonuclease VapC